MAWKRFLAVGCSHGSWADPDALKTVLKFKKAWKPHKTVHLGDYLDMAAFRSGAGRLDEHESVEDDLAQGLNFLECLEPNVIFDGNHDDRVCKMLVDPNAKLAFAAKTINEEINKLVTKLRAERVPYDIERGWRRPFGSDTNVGHGYMFNENALRDHAEAFGKCIIAHLHVPGSANGRRLDGAVGYCSGYLGLKEKFAYAKTNKSKLRWNNGFLWGEYNDEETLIRVEQKARTGWRLPL